MPASPLVRRALTALLLLPALALADGYPRLSRERFWLPATYDAATLALFAFDEKAEATEIPDLDALDDLDDPLDLGGGPPAAPGAGPSAANSAPVGKAADLVGGAKLVPEGRFRGGLQLDGQGAAVAHGLGGGDGRTIDFWIRPAKLPKQTAVLAAWGEPRKACGRLLLDPDGTVRLEWFGQELATAPQPLAAGEWTHLAVGVSLTWPHEDVALLHQNGHASPRLEVEHKQAHVVAKSASNVSLGADLDGSRGVAALVDEFRVSRRLRRYYGRDLGWVRPGQPVAGHGPPHFRDPDDLIFYLPFEGTTAPQVAAPDTRHDVTALKATDFEQDPALVQRLFPPGVLGRAMALGDQGLRPQYGALGNILPAQGTVAFWLRPVDWDNLTRDNRLDQINPLSFGIFQLDAKMVEGSHEALFRKIGPILQFTATMHISERAQNPVDLYPGTWTHVAMTWEATKCTYYINGERRSPQGALHADIDRRTAHDPYPYQHLSDRWWLECTPVNLRFRENRYWDQRGEPMPRSLIDDFRIYRRPLAPAEIANLHALGDPRVPLQELPQADMEMTWNGVSGRIRAKVTPLGADYAKLAKARVSVRQDGQGEPVGQAEEPFGEGGMADVTVQTPPLEFARYVVTAELLDAAGQVRGQVEQEFTRTAPPWWECEAGLSDKVMPPWTPVQVADSQIKVWGREITFGGDGLPQAIVSAGQDVLAAPLRFVASNGGQALPLQTAEPPALHAEDETRATARGRLTGPGFAVTVASYTEFDGMMWFTVTLTPDGEPVPLDRLDLLIPRTAESCRYIHWWSGPRNFRNPRCTYVGKLPTEEGVVFRSDDRKRIDKLEQQRGNFMPYVMLTGDDRGMAWFAENDQGWTPNDEAPAITLTRAENTVEMKLAILSRPITLDGPRTFSFGLHPIPVRPLDPLWRQYPVYSNVFPDTFSGNNLKGEKDHGAFFLYPEDDWDAVQRRIDGEGKTKGAAGLKGLYRRKLDGFARKGITDPPPQILTVPGLYWDMQWNGIPQTLEHTREWSQTWALNFQYYTPEFIDFCSWAWNDWIAKTDGFVQGAYIDDCWPAPITRKGGPCTYTLADGHTQPGFQFLGYRERFKRMRQISLDHGQVPHFTAHTTHTLMIPYHSFFDLILDGEDHYSSPPGQSDFLDKWSLPRLRFMHNRKWGLVTTWLGWHGNSLDTDKWPAWTFRQSRAYTAGMAMHDILWALGGGVREEIEQPDTRFVPYWEATGLATHEHEHLRVVAWQRPGKCFVMLVNLGQERLEATVRLHPRAMGFEPGARLLMKERDPTHLSYFETDVTTLEKPEVGEEAIELGGDLGLELEEKEEDLPVAERRARDPDGAKAWADGVLTCPVRRHDYRLFEFTPAK